MSASSNSSSYYNLSSYSDTSFSSEYQSEMETPFMDSTSSRPGAASLIKAPLPKLLPLLREDVEGKFCPNVPISEFVQHVWGIDINTINHVLKGDVVLDHPALERYRKATLGPAMCQLFSRILDSLVQQVKTSLGNTNPTSVSFWSQKGTYVIALSEGSPAIWIEARQIFELERNPNTLCSAISSTLKKFITTKLTSFSPLKKTKARPTTLGQLGSDTGIASEGKDKRTLRSDTRAARFTPAPTTPMSNTDEGFPRLLFPADDDPKRELGRLMAKPHITNEQLQLATYVLEALAVSTRYYTSGLFINGFEVSLWYYDRACVIRTYSFDFTREPNKLALIAYAMTVCDDRHVGLDPFMTHAPRDTPESPGGLSGARSTRTREKAPSSIIGQRVQFPGVRHAFTIEDLIHTYRRPIGRGTMVYGVAHEQENVSAKALLFPRSIDKVLKVSWPLVVRHLEAETIGKLVLAIPGWADNLPKVHDVFTRTADQLQLPRVEILKLNDMPQIEERQMHAIFMAKCGKIWEVETVEEFEDAFLDCFECHYHSYYDARVIHRDLSDSNLMFRRLDNGEIRGVLNDWDMASHLNDGREILISSATYRTGTRPFMARDLLSAKPPPHLYRHDLESFFYILVWAAIHFDLKNKRSHRPLGIDKEDTDNLDSWTEGNLRSVYNAKTAFLTDHTSSDDIFRLIRPEFNTLRDKWLIPLWELFRAAVYSVPKRDLSYDNATYGGQLTFITFMATLGRKPRGLYPHGQPNVSPA